MITVYSDRHRLHHARAELNDGDMMPAFERPERADAVHARVLETGLGEVKEPEAFGYAPLRRIHTDRYLGFLRTAWQDWHALHGDCDALPLAWPARGLRHVEPAHIDGRLGYYSFDAGTPITAGTWAAASAAADIALTATRLVGDGERAAFALCRPPGHHAGADYFGGYCYLNNAAIAAASFLETGARRVAVLDIDYHHGNGTQELFYERSDVLFCSIHCDPRQEYPFFLGYGEETGRGDGAGCNLNLPLAPGSDWAAWSEALSAAIDATRRYAPDALVVSLGVDTYERDPIAAFRLQTDDYHRIGERLAALRLPTVFVLEGGYAVPEIGENVVNVLQACG
ncbi:MAG: histone deacetylase family protein [Gammaproteobacteria bacterium]